MRRGKICPFDICIQKKPAARLYWAGSSINTDGMVQSILFHFANGLRQVTIQINSHESFAKITTREAFWANPECELSSLKTEPVKTTKIVLRKTISPKKSCAPSTFGHNERLQSALIGSVGTTATAGCARLSPIVNGFNKFQFLDRLANETVHAC